MQALRFHAEMMTEPLNDKIEMVRIAIDKTVVSGTRATIYKTIIMSI